jgi:IS30 family transposase
MRSMTATSPSRPSIKQMYEAGLSLREIEGQTDIPYSTIRERLIAYGVEIRKRGSGNANRMNHEACRQTAFMYEVMGLSTTEIADKLGLAHDTIVNRLHHHGVEMRSRSESLRLRFAKRPKARPSND